MPRKRTTRTAHTSRQPKAPVGDEGADLMQELKVEKFKTLKADFDTQTASFFKGLQENIKDFEKTIECTYSMSLSKIPKYIRDMSVEDYLKAGGTLGNSTESGDQLSQQIEMSLGPNLSLDALTKSKKKKKKSKSSLVSGEATTVKRPAPRRKKTAVNNNATGSENMPPPPSTMRTGRTTRQRAQFETPYQMGGPGAAGWETPLITPKFDPRLPVTPAMTRRPKAGEVFMSLAGSPITNEKRKSNKLTVNTKAQKSKIVFDELEVDLDDINVPDYEQATMEYLRMMRDKLNAIPLSPKR